MAGELFKKAARYRKSHPGMTMQQAVKAVAKKKPAARKKAAPKKRAAHVGRAKKSRTVPKKVKIKVRKVKNGTSLSISGMATGKINQELSHLRSLESACSKHKELLKQKGLKAAEKAAIRRDIAKYGHAIRASKKHIQSLKRSI